MSEEAGQAIDLEGATVMPGLIDSHSHWIGDKDIVGSTARQAIDKALSWGWTSISELFVSFERLGELCDLELSGDLRVKVGAFLPLNYQQQRFGNWYDDYEPGEEFGPHVWVQGLKFFADGAPDGLGYQTDPPSPSVQGALFWKRRGLEAAFRRANNAGWQITIHATGDGASTWRSMRSRLWAERTSSKRAIESSISQPCGPVRSDGCASSASSDRSNCPGSTPVQRRT
jgi:predicted amidohydrolase YtcJ